MSLTKATYSMISGAVGNVLDYGADPTGVGNSTAAFNAALAANNSVFVPAGTYAVKNITGIRSGSELFGEGETSILKMIDTTGDSHVLDINHNTFDQVYTGIYVHDLQLQGSSATPVFTEQCHLIAMTGVTGGIFERLKLFAFAGDGFYIGSGDSGVDEYHNNNITIRDCFFDGVNKENRQGISVIDCNNLLIDRCNFVNITKSTMPGAIDIEPDGNAYHVVKNITVSNSRFFNIGGSFAVIGVLLPVDFTTAATGFYFTNNFIEQCGVGFAFRYDVTGGVAEASNSFGLNIVGNTVKDSGCPFKVFNVKDCSIINNQFNVVSDGAFVSFSGANQNAIDVVISNNLFYKVGSSDGSGLQIFNATRVTITGNEFNDCGVGTVGNSNAIVFNTGTSSNVTISNNNFVTPNGTTLVAILKQPLHTYTPAGNIRLQNRFSGLPANFDYRIGDPIFGTAPPVAGAWSVNDRVFNSVPAAAQPQGWVNSVAGTPGTWLAMANLA
jgi:hypothetical protein